MVVGYGPRLQRSHGSRSSRRPISASAKDLRRPADSGVYGPPPLPNCRSCFASCLFNRQRGGQQPVGERSRSGRPGRFDIAVDQRSGGRGPDPQGEHRNVDRTDADLLIPVGAMRSERCFLLANPWKHSQYVRAGTHRRRNDIEDHRACA